MELESVFLHITICMYMEVACFFLFLEYTLFISFSHCVPELNGAGHRICRPASDGLQVTAALL